MQSYKRLFFLVFATGALIRVFVALTLPDSSLSDTTYHLAIAEHITKTGFFPFEGIPKLKLTTVPPGIFHTFIASTALLTLQNVSLSSAIGFKLTLCIVQFLTAFILLKKIFPKNWVYGMAFFTAMPLVSKYAGVNYVETIATIFVMVSLHLLIEFHKTGQKKFLAMSAFSLSAMAMSKLNATIMLPAFLLFAVFECKQKKLSTKYTLTFTLSTLALSSTWFIADLLRSGRLFSSISPLAVTTEKPIAGPVLTILKPLLFTLEFNAGFWAFPPKIAFQAPPLSQALNLTGLSYEAVFLGFTALTLPILLFTALSTISLIKKKPALGTLLASIFLLAMLVVVFRAIHFVFARMFLPAMPLLSIAFVHGFKHVSKKWKKALAALTVLVATYSFLNVSLLALHYNQSFQKSIDLYNAISTLPKDSKVVIAGNHVRTVRWTTEIETIGPEEAFKIPKTEEPTQKVKALPKQEIYETLKALRVTHLAVTCIDDPWNKNTINELKKENLLKEVFKKECAVLFKLN